MPHALWYSFDLPIQGSAGSAGGLPRSSSGLTPKSFSYNRRSYSQSWPNLVSEPPPLNLGQLLQTQYRRRARVVISPKGNLDGDFGRLTGGQTPACVTRRKLVVWECLCVPCECQSVRRRFLQRRRITPGNASGAAILPPVSRLDYGRDADSQGTIYEFAAG